MRYVVKIRASVKGPDGQRARRSTRSPDPMHDLRTRYVADASAPRPKSPAQIGVLPVKEEPFIEPTDGIKRIAPRQ